MVLVFLYIFPAANVLLMLRQPLHVTLLALGLAIEASSSSKQAGTEQAGLLAKMGYHFDDAGVMRDKDGKQYVFSDQSSYEKIGLGVTAEIYRIMENPPYNMKRQYLNDEYKEKSSFIFVSEDWDKKEHLIVLIHGSGAVRAGQWARRLIMNENLYVGSQLLYLRSCQHRNWGVIVMNTNQNEYVSDDGSVQLILEGSSPVQHGLAVWKKYVTQANAVSIAVIAHSAGGLVIAGIIENFWTTESSKKLKCVCLTDAVFTLPSIEYMDFIPKIRNWVATSCTEVGMPVEYSGGKRDYISYVSSGTSRHDRTSATAMEDIFKFIENCFK